MAAREERSKDDDYRETGDQERNDPESFALLGHLRTINHNLFCSSQKMLIAQQETDSGSPRLPYAVTIIIDISCCLESVQPAKNDANSAN